MARDNPYASSIAVTAYLTELWELLDASMPLFEKRKFRNIQSVVSTIVFKGAYQQIFSERELLIKPARSITPAIHANIVSELRRAGVAEYKIEDLTKLFAPADSYYKNTRGIIKNIDIEYETVFETLLRLSKTDIRDFSQIELFMLFVDKQVEREASEGQFLHATDNAKAIAFVFLNPIYVNPRFEERVARWFASYALLSGAIVAAAVENHHALRWFCQFSYGNAKSACGSADNFVVSVDLYLQFLRAKHFLDMADHFYPKDDPAIRSYIVQKQLNKSAFNVPIWFSLAALRAASVEMRHRGYFVNCLDPTLSEILRDLKNVEPVTSLNVVEDEHRVMALISGGWNNMRAGNLNKVDEILTAAQGLVPQNDKPLSPQREIDHLWGSWSLKSTMSGTYNHRKYKELLMITAENFSKTGTLTRAESIFDETK